MALIKCPECKKKVSDQCGRCPNCGFPIEVVEKSITALNDNTIDTDIVVEKETEQLPKERKPINKKLLIGIISAAVVLLTVGGVLGYNALLPRINATKEFNAVVKLVEKKNSELEKAIVKSEELIAKKQPLLDETLVSKLENSISDTKAVKITDFKKPKTVEEIISRSAELNKVDYSTAIQKLSENHTALEINAKRYQLVNNPTEAFVLKRIENIRKVAGMIDVVSLTEDNDPENYIGKPGWYTIKVIFRHKDVKHYGLDNGLLKLNEVGNPAGGCIEVYKTEEDAQRRANQLKSQEGTLKSPGARVVCGTVLVRVSDGLKASYQQELLTLIVEELTKFEDEKFIENEQSPSKEDANTTTTTEQKLTETKPSSSKPTTTATTPKTTKSKKELAIEAAHKYRNDNKGVILSVYELYEHLSGLGYSDVVCEDVCFKEKIDGFYDGTAMYDYERIQMFKNQGYSREIIIDFYVGIVESYEDAEYLVDECLAGRKLTYEYIDDEMQLIEHD